TKESFSGREVTENVVALAIERRTADLDQSRVVSPAIEAELAQPRGIELGGRNGRCGDGCLLVESLYRWVILQLHDDTPFGEQVVDCQRRAQLEEGTPVPTATASWQHPRDA